jgi:hypothetical protein
MTRAPVPAAVLLAALAAGCDTAPSAEAGDVDAAAPATDGIVRYPDDRRHSPITPAIAERLRAIAAAGPDQDGAVFAKVGDSITESTAFLHCFAGDGVELDGRDQLAGTIAHFLGGDAAGEPPYTRDSLAATVGWAARGPLAGEPSYLDQELAAIRPRYASVMFGTNDVGYRSHDQFGADLWTIVDQLAARGVVPLLSTIPPIDSDPAIDARVPLFNRVIRALAQGRQLPMVDFHRELSPLPDHGLASDGVHPTASPLGACDLTADGLLDGYNLRNLITIEALDRIRHALDGEPAPDAVADGRAGAGLAADPYLAALPFADLADTRDGVAAIDRYPGCDGETDEGGPELVYRLELDAPTELGAYVVDRDEVDVDVHIVTGDLDGAACVARGHHEAIATVGPGVVHVVVDSWVDDAGVARAGEFLLVIERTPAP